MFMHYFQKCLFKEPSNSHVLSATTKGRPWLVLYIGFDFVILSTPGFEFVSAAGALRRVNARVLIGFWGFVLEYSGSFVVDLNVGPLSFWFDFLLSPFV